MSCPHNPGKIVPCPRHDCPTQLCIAAADRETELHNTGSALRGLPWAVAGLLVVIAVIAGLA